MRRHRWWGLGPAGRAAPLALALLAAAAAPGAAQPADTGPNRTPDAERDRQQQGRIAQLEAHFPDALTGGDPTRQLAACRILTEMGPRDLNVLLTALRPPEWWESSRETAAGRERQRVEIERALVALTAPQADPAVRLAAARALGRIGPDPAGAARALQPLLGDADPAVRTAGIDGLAGLSQDLVAPTQTGNPRDISRALLPIARPVVPLLAGAIADPDPTVRRRALESLRSLTDPLADAPVSSGNRDTLASLAGVVADHAAEIAAALGGSPSERPQAGRVLENLATVRLRLVPATWQPQADAHAPTDPAGRGLMAVAGTLTQALCDPDRRVRQSAVQALEGLPEANDITTPVFVQALHDPDPFVRWAAVRGLARNAPAQADLAIPALARLLTERDFDVRLRAIEALQRYGLDRLRPTLPALARAALRGDADSRLKVIGVLDELKADTAEVVDAHAASLTADDGRVRKAAAEALLHLGPRAKAAVPALRGALEDSDPDVRRTAGEAILAISRER
jgi:HEAT repeat protein